MSHTLQTVSNFVFRALYCIALYCILFLFVIIVASVTPTFIGDVKNATNGNNRNNYNDNTDTRLEGEKGFSDYLSQHGLMTSSETLSVEIDDSHLRSNSQSVVNVEADQVITGKTENFSQNLKNQMYIENNVLIDDIVHHIDTNKG